MKKFVFVILHYYVIEETIQCVNSIRDIINNKNYEIVIVDNGSKNNTGNELLKKYKKEKNIHVILSEKNLGFANGNNIGFKYAKDNLKPDFIIMINSDVYMLQSNFLDLIDKEYEKSSFAVLGPRIIIPNNRVCDYIDEFPSLKFLKKRRFYTRLLYFYNKIYIRKVYLFYIRIKEKIKKKIVKQKIIDTSVRKENVLLHGCSLIFSKKYIDLFDGIDDRTFLYYEEFLLYLRLRKSNLLSVYNPYLIVYHNESSSTNKVNSKKRKKFDFVLKNELKSINIVIDDIKNGDIYGQE